ncbi:MAG: hypothetical protein Fur0018_04680 [Anaerolineales bacterium]
MNSKPRLPFWQSYLRILGIDSALVFVLALLLNGLPEVSNLYFLSSVILFGVAVLPVFTEVGGNFRTVYRLSRGEKMTDLVRAQEDAAKTGWRITLLYGACGFSTFFLSILTSMWWPL